MRFWLGLFIGAALGSSSVYLVLERPWQRGSGAPRVATSVPGDAGVVAPKGGKKKKRGGGGGGGGGTTEYPIDDEIVLSDADRRLEWRGDEVSLPKTVIDMTSEGQGRPLADGEIQSAIAGGSGAVIDCITAAATGAPLSGTITVKALVDGGGRVKRVRAQAPSFLWDRGMFGCLRRAVAGWDFPATGGETVVTAPFELN